jgi:hypothetical protein
MQKILRCRLNQAHHQYVDQGGLVDFDAAATPFLLKDYRVRGTVSIRQLLLLKAEPAISQNE